MQRKQKTRIGDISSEIEDVNQGLVQGGINSAIWYNIYTYDMKYINRKTHLYTFADDSCIVSTHSDVATAVKNAQDDFIEMQKYFYKNQIYLNAKKTEAMVLGFARKRMDMSEHRIRCHSRQCLSSGVYASGCDCLQVEFKDNVRYLGLFIDDEFKMKTHAIKLSKKLRIVNYKLNKINASQFPLTTRKTIYFSLVDALLRYGAPFYTFAPKYALDTIHQTQNRIKSYLFKGRENNVPIFTPNELAISTLLSLNFHKQEFRNLNQQPYLLRRQRFNRIKVNTVTYGNRILGYRLPTLLNELCEEFIDETDSNKIKDKIKEKLLSLQE